MRYVIIGNSAAGIFAAEAIRKHDPIGQVDILSDENYPAYARCMTSYFLGGKISDAQLYIRDKDFYSRNKFNLHTGQKVIGIDTVKREVRTITGELFTYNRLLIATGASPTIPELEGIDNKGIFGLRTLTDAKGILNYIGQGQQAVVMGGGFVALKAAYALQKAGKDVTCIITSGQVLSQMLDREAADIVANVLTSKGIKIKFYTDVKKIVGYKNRFGEKGVKSLQLINGEEIPADVVIIGKGVTPNIDFLEDSGINVDYGITVNEYMQTNVTDVYAAGDVAQGEDIISGRLSINAIWPNATDQGTIAGMNMTGVSTIYSGSIGMNSADFYGLSTIAAGLTKGKEADGYEVVRLFPGKNIYRKLVFKEDRLKGYILVGQTAKAGILTALIKDQVPLGKTKADLKLGRIRQKLLG